MRRLRPLLLLVFLLASFALAQDDTPIAIDWSPEQTTVSGTVEVHGTVNPQGLQSHFIEVARDDTGDRPQWQPVSLPNRTPVMDGALAQWNTTMVDDGLYRLRLHVVLTSGESVYYTIAPIAVNNGGGTTSDDPVRVVQTPGAAALPAASSPVPQPENELPVSVGGHVLTFNETTQETMRQAGMTWVKWQIPFLMDDPDGLVNVARDRIRRSHAAGFRVLLSIKGEVDDLRDLGEDYYPIFAEVLRRVAAHGPDAIEVWNEMNIDREWPTGRISPQSYLAMLRPAYEAIKAVDPAIMVISGALSPTGAEGAFGLDKVWNDDRYYQGMANAGVADYADCIGLHYNEGIIGPRQLGGDPRDDYPTRYFRPMLDRVAVPFRGDDVPLCLTEMGYLTPGGYGPLPDGFAWAGNTSVAEQAQWLAEAVQLAGDYERKSVRLIIIWNVDFDNYEQDPQAGYAIIRPDGTCPACETLAALREP